jgi:presenilin-like A22 family membrane protease
MKHSLIITLILLGMFILTQLLGLFIVYQYTPKQVIIDGDVQNIAPQLPYGTQPPEIEPKISLISILFAFVLAISIFFLLSSIRAELIIKIWFFIVVVLAVGISANALLFWGSNYHGFFTDYSEFIAFIIALPLAYFKIFKRSILVHNFTELLIYPGIAALFIPILNVWTIILLLIAISLYDMYAVWHSGFMQKMAKYQIKSLGIFSGFFVPYINPKVRERIKLMKPSQLKKRKIKVNVALLGGGDVVFPIIASGIVFKFWGLIPALFVIAGATSGLIYLFFIGEKGKFYPAMPFITIGIFLGMLAGYLLNIIA